MRQQSALGNVLLAVFFCVTASLPILAQRGPTVLVPSQMPRGEFSVKTTLPLSITSLPELSALSIDLRRSFVTQGEAVIKHEGTFSPLLLPGTGLLRRQQANEYAQLHESRGNSYALEVLMAMELPSSLSELDNDELELAIFNILHRLSTLEGLQYFSASRGVQREFYISSGVVGEDGKTPLPDPVFNEMPEQYSFLMRQEDASFGDYLYQVQSSNGRISIQNVDRMFYAILPIAEPGALDLTIQVVPSGDQLLFYAFTSLNAPRIFGIRDRMSNSFYNRITALYLWFYEQASLTDF